MARVGTSSDASSHRAAGRGGVFPRAALELMRTPGVRSIRALRQAYHENNTR